MSKVDYYKAEYHRTLRDLTKNPSVWKSFLSSAAYQYKYTFRDQIMIYAQRPTAIACAEYDVWSKNLGRWVKRGAQGIALLQFRGGKSTLRYVFDSQDTRNAENEELTIWSVAKEHEKAVIGALEERFGTLVNTDHLAEALLSACANAVEDNLTDYVSELVDSSENSFLDDLDEDNLRVRLRRTVRESVIFSVMTRLGYDVDEYLDSDAFEWVHEFNTPACINILGSATSEISELCLREIERTVKLAEKIAPLTEKRIGYIIKAKKNKRSKKTEEIKMTRLTYRTVNGVQIPNLRLPKQKNYPLGKYAMMRHDFLEKHRKGTYTTLLTEFRLAEHLYETEQRAKEQITKITAEMVQRLGVNEQMKASDPMKWVQMMNNIKKTAEDTVLQELIYT